MVSCTPKEEKTIITGSIENPATESFEISYLKDFITNKPEKHEVVLDEANSFHIELDIREPVMAQMEIKGEEQIALYIMPGDNLRITADGEDVESTLAFYGTNADNNTLLFLYNKNLDDKFRQQQAFNKMRSLEPEELVVFSDEMLEAKKKLFAELTKDKNISDRLEHLLNTEIHYEYYTNRLIYPMYMIQKNKWEELPEDYFAFLDDALEISDDKLVSSNYRNFIDHYLDYYKQNNPEEVPEDLSPVKTSIHLAEKLLEGKTLQHTKAVLIYNEFYLGEFEKAEKLYKSFLEEEPGNKIADILTTTYENIKSTLPGNPAPDFELTDINGEVVSLSDFRGKVVYLDFWASWCPPCMYEVPYAKELKERFKDEEDLVFLYISIDENTDSWRNTVKDREIKGVHLNVSGRYHEVPKSYNVRWIPTYHIIDRNGIIFENNAKRPSNESIDDDLKAALETVS